MPTSASGPVLYLCQTTLAGLEVIGGESAARGEFVTTEADEHLAIRNQRRRRAVFTLVRVVVLDDPGLFAGLRVERDQPAVEGQVDDLAIAISTTAVDGVAAGARNSRFITIGLLDVVPDFLRVVRDRSGQAPERCSATR